MPLKYGADALRNIMIRGAGWDRIWLGCSRVAAFTICLHDLKYSGIQEAP